jgi:hypothetical protein
MSGRWDAQFSISARRRLFESFLRSDDNILVQTVETLGRLPDPWWRSFEDRALYFEDREIKGYEVEEWLKSVLTFF